MRTVRDWLGHKDVETTIPQGGTRACRTGAGEGFTSRSTGCGCPFPANPEGLGAATGRPKKAEATCRMKRKYLHAKHLPPRPSCGGLGLGRPRWRFMRVSLNKS